MALGRGHSWSKAARDPLPLLSLSNSQRGVEKRIQKVENELSQSPNVEQVGELAKMKLRLTRMAEMTIQNGLLRTFVLEETIDERDWVKGLVSYYNLINGTRKWLGMYGKIDLGFVKWSVWYWCLSMGNYWAFYGTSTHLQGSGGH